MNLRFSLALAITSALCACTGVVTNPDPANPGTSGKPDDPGGGGGGSGGGGGGGTGSGTGGGGSTSGQGRYFAQGFFYQDVSGVAKAANSDATIRALAAAGGWGNGNVMQIDFSIDVIDADANAPRRSMAQNDYGPDCDTGDVPMPAGGNIEGETGYQCSDPNADCHLLVWAKAEKKLYEVYQANLVGNTLEGTCMVVWDTQRAYPASGRGEQCTSADAAGFPIAPLLFNADEVKAGAINHAIRFILPNNRVRRGYVRPASHGTTTTGGTDAPYYGVHFRLKANFDMSRLPNEAARTVARAMQKYGMYHADGGNIALTAQSDRHTTAKWDGLLAPRDLAAIKVEDFEVIDHGPAQPVTFDCVRNP